MVTIVLGQTIDFPVMKPGKLSRREEHVMYVHHLLEKTGLNQTELAARSGLSESTLSAFLTAKDGKRGLGGKTLHALGAHTGIWFRGVEAGRVVEFPLGRAHEQTPGFTEADAIPYRPLPETSDPVAEAIARMTAEHNAIDAWELRSRALEAIGFQPGDILLVDLANIGPAPGDIVCAQIFDRSGRSAETVFRVFEPPCLVAATSERALLRPYVINADVIIKGTVLTSIRLRRRAA